MTECRFPHHYVEVQRVTKSRGGLKCQVKNPEEKERSVINDMWIHGPRASSVDDRKKDP